ncbi:hypothetical protein BGZ61DRAFT_468621 [Ilyonectria robusta]|uniref:uncharacterized protein n=1 Tax=Ilyonectria robusta TaxID=1079257 RepID=UPI001E8CF4EF|nr:uncharacterized protein BGZ61DRAFT_468621 [Ilyonectria robusta]KAH8652569.1 hypothetical protein BGZ61DRAFT_468621 [Ilyonectria robusta]
MIVQRQHKQFLLIIQNLSMAVAQEASLYKGVMKVWKSALGAMEGLISGSPFVVTDGTVLVGLSAWHLYPDMAIFSGQSCNKQVPMNDQLVKAGRLLSLGKATLEERKPRVSTGPSPWPITSSMDKP